MQYSWTEHTFDSYQSETFYSGLNVDGSINWGLLGDWLINDSWEQANFSTLFDWMLGFNEHWRSYNLKDSDSANYKGDNLRFDVSTLLDESVHGSVQMAAEYISGMLGVDITVNYDSLVAGTDADLEIAPTGSMMTTRWADELLDAETAVIQTAWDVAYAAAWSAAVAASGGASVLLPSNIQSEIYALALNAVMEQFDFPPVFADVVEAIVSGNVVEYIDASVNAVSFALNDEFAGTWHLPGTTWDLNPIAAIAEIAQDNLPDGFDWNWHPSAFYHDMAVIFYGQERLEGFNEKFTGLTDDERSYLVLGTMIHEMGHVLGLGHLGEYNGTWDHVIKSQAEYDDLGNFLGIDEVSDSNVFLIDAPNISMMSYGYADDGLDPKNPNVSWRGNDPITWMGADLFAFDTLYGLNETFEEQNTVWGYNSNVSVEYLKNLLSVYDGLEAKITWGTIVAPTFSIYDTGGDDILDLSETDNDIFVNLNPNSFSDVQGGVENMYIAQNVFIENYVGGEVSDQVIGNERDNIILTSHELTTSSSGAGIFEIAGVGYALLSTTRSDRDVIDLSFGGNNTVISGAGQDEISGGAGNDFIDSGTDNDVIDLVFGGDDSVISGSGDDIITLSVASGVATIESGEGIDSIRIFDRSLSDALIHTGAGKDSVYLIPNTDPSMTASGTYFVYTDGGLDDIETSDGDDVVRIYNHSNVKVNGGDDVIILQNYENTSAPTTIDGGSDNDWLIFSEDRPTISFPSGLLISNTLEQLLIENLNAGADIPTPQLVDVSGIENIVGTDFADTIQFTDTSQFLALDRIRGGAGNDRIEYKDGNTSIEGGHGNDLIYLFGNSGNVYGEVSSTVTAGNNLGVYDNNDNPFGNFGVYELGRVDSNDGTNDTVLFASSTQSGALTEIGRIEVNFITKKYTNNDGYLYDISGIETLSFMPNQDYALDFIGSIDNKDVAVFGSKFDDTFISNSADEVLAGWGGDDLFMPGAGDTTVHGGLGNDTIDGVMGDYNFLNGDNMPNTGQEIYDPDGIDWLYAYSSEEKAIYVDDKTTTGAFIELEVEGGKEISQGGLIGVVTYTGYGTATNIENVWIRGDRDNPDIASYHDTIIGNSLNNYFDSTEGDDFQRGNEGDDTLIGGSGNDTLEGNSGNDWYFGGEGIDEASFFNEIDVIVDLLNRDDIEELVRLDSFEAFRERLQTSDNLETYFQTFIGTDNDVLFEIENLRGGAGDDRLFGNKDDNHIWGENGDDILWGEAGNDTLHGGLGRDTFIYTSGNDVFDGGASVDFINFAEITGPLVIDFTQSSFGEFVDGYTIELTSIEGIEATRQNDTLIGGESDDAFRGGDGDDSISGNDGNDDLDGQNGNDVIDGGSGNDTVLGGIGNDTINSGAFDVDASDDDLVVGGLGDDQVHAQDGDDLIFGDDSSRDAGGNFITPGLETDNDGNDYLNGGRGNDTIYGGGGDDYIDSGLDDDSVYAGAGNDYVLEYGSVYGSESDHTSGDDFYDGGSGKDTLDYSGSSHAINASLANKSITGVATGQDTVTNFEVLIATDYDDTISTADHSDTIYGGYGDDHITAIGGKDSILGDGGNDTIAVVDSSGRDTLSGGEGTDTLDLSGLSSGSVVSLVDNVLEAEIGVSKLESIENVLGSQNKDEIIGSKEGNILLGAGGDDRILGQDGSDTIEGGTGNDFIDLRETEATRDVIKFSNDDGDDTISGIDWDLFLQANDERMDKLDLSAFLDTSGNLVTQEDAKVEISADGNLIITFFEGSKLTILGSGSSFAETLERLEISPLEFIESPEFALALDAFGLGAWLGNGVVDGTENADLIDEDYDSDPEGDKIDNSDAPISTNSDVIDAGKGNDTIFADAGSDQLVVESGDGDDDVDLGPGDDLINEADGSGDDTYDGGADLDTIDFSAVTSEMYINLNNGAAFSDTSGHDTVSNFERVISSQKSDEVFGTDLDSEYFETLAGDDTIFSGAGSDTIISGEDNDVINPGDGKDIVDAGSGNDVVAFRGLELSGLKILNGGIGIDTLNLSLLQTNATINLAEKTVYAGGNISELSSFENVVSTQFSDSIIGSDLANEINSGAGNDTIDGGDGQDTIYADAGDDIVDAGNGDDIIIAGSGLGDDTYKGGEGTDHIIYSSATAGILVNLAVGEAKSFSTQDASIGYDEISGVEKVTAGDFDDFIIGSDTSNHIEALSGNDTIYGGYGDNTILGGAGDDLLIIGRGKSEIDGGSGNNKVLIDANVEDILFSKTDGTITVKTETIFANLTNVAELWLNDAVLDETLIKNGSEDIILSLDELNLGENNQNSGLIKISGRAEQGQILTADLDSLIDLDGVDQTSVTYQWFADGVVLEGAVLKELALSSDLVGASVRVDVAFNDNSGNREHARSMASKPIANVNDAPIGTHTIEGDLNVGSVLVVKNDGVVDPDGEISNVSYQWFRSGVKINGATDEIYELTNTDKFSTISVQMTYTDAAGFMNTVVSDPTDAVTSDGISTITLSATRKLFIPNNITLPTDFAFETLVQASSDLDEMRTNLVGSFNGLFVDTTAQDEDVTELGDFLNNVSIKSIARSQSVVLSKYDFEQLELGDAPELALSIQENSNNEELFVLSGLSQEKTLVLHGAQFVAVTGNARILGGTGQNTLFGDGASQNVMLGADDDMLSAGGGDDIVGSAGGNDTVSGGSGNDVTFGGTGNDSVNGGTGNDKVTDSWGTDELNGDDGNDVIRSFEGGDTINGGAGADTIYGSRGDDVISGGDDDDVIYGDTFVFASRGADELSGGNGDDVLQGGFGADTFIFNSGETGDNRIERIDTQTADFEVGIDKIKLLGFGDDMTADNILAQWQDTTEGAKLTAGDMSILLTGISTDDLLVTDFVFV